MNYAHSLSGQPRSQWETLEDHARNVARAAQRRAEPFGAGAIAHILGMLHDLGKEKPAFQQKLLGAVSDVSHSGEGAKALAKMGGFSAALAGTIAGHHGRLPDPDRLKARISAADDIRLPSWCQVTQPIPPERLTASRELAPYRLQFLVRMLYGALCDADDSETAAFYANAEGREIQPRMTELTKDLRDAFDAHMRGLGGTGDVNDLRRAVLAHARRMASAPPGLFTLTVPTGGGKTLTSLGFGLDHALQHGLRRLIYVIPYTSIIEQTADVFRQAFGEDHANAVLEHHSNADWDGEDESEAEQLRVMGASWDVPVVVTTAVQFFESLYAARKKRCRKLPSLARSVIVLDEAQTMPLALLRPCLASLHELMDGYGASVVLSTATQPSLTQQGGFPGDEALEDAREIAPDPDRLFAALKRVEVRDVGPLNDAALAERLRLADQVLAIVDNRMQARALFDAICDAEGAMHLSTLMVPAHRRDVLADIHARLHGGLPVRLVSTSLIEAGVDVDFPHVLRAATGIDSIAQAAGRCNREGRLHRGLVEVFRSEHPAPPAVEQFAAIGRAVLAEGHDDPIGQAAVASYFRRLWEAYGAEALDAVKTAGHAGILTAIRKSGAKCPYEQIEAAFRVIPEEGPSVIVRDGEWGVPSRVLDKLRFAPPGVAARELQPYRIAVPWSLWTALRHAGHVDWWEPDQFDEQFALLQTSALYHPQAGLSGEGDIGGIV